MSRSIPARRSIATATLTAATLIAIGGASTASALVETTPPPRGTTPGFTFVDYAVPAGTSTLKAVAKPLPLAGTLKADLNSHTSSYSAAFVGDPTSVAAKAYGFLPVTASVNEVVSLSGALTNTGQQSSLAATVRFIAPSIKAYGTQIAGGTACQTAAAPIALAPASPPFDLATGGALAGSFAVGNLSGCGALSGVVASMIAGDGNSLAFTANRLG